MRRALAMVAGGVLVAGLITFLPQTTPSAHAEPPGDGDSGGFSWQYSESSRGYYQPPGESTEGGGGEPDPDTVITFTEAFSNEYECGDHHPQVPGCADSSSWCNPDPEVHGFRAPVYAQFSFSYHWRDRADETKWWLTGGDAFTASECIETPEFVPDEEIAEEFKYALFEAIEPPEIDNKPTTGLVNLPTIVWTNGREEFQTQIVVPPSPDTGRDHALTGYIDAHTEYYRWNFDGEDTAEGLGKPYTDTVDPTEPNNYYISGLFETKGAHQINLDVRWLGTVLVENLPEEELYPVEYGESKTINVVDSSAVLDD